MSTPTPPVQRRRDKLRALLPARSRAVSPLPAVVSTSTSAPPQISQPTTSSIPASVSSSTLHPVSTPAVSTSSTPPPQQVVSPNLPVPQFVTSTPSSANPALLAAIQKHLDKLPERDKERFRQASATITDENLLSDIEKLNGEHKSNSAFRRHADKLSKFLGLHKSGNRKEFATWKTLLRLQLEPFEESFGEVEARMKHHRENLLHAASATLLSATEIDRRKRESDLQQRRQEQQHRETQEQNEKKVNERTELLKWLSPHGFDHKQDDTFKIKHQGTGDWLLQTEEFLEWEKATSSQLLWCHGKPGAGKSVLASHVIDHLQRAPSASQSGLCFSYFSFSDSTFHGAVPLILALLKQLCQQQRSVPDTLSKAKQEARDPATVSSIKTFVEAAKPFLQTFVVIDGLDECPEEKRSPIMEFMVEASNITGSCIKVFVSSRKEHDISFTFRRLNVPAIELEAGKIGQDIRSFVHDEALRLRRTSELCIHSEDLFREVVEALVSKSDGMFLWVSLQLKQLCKASETDSDYYVKQALSDMPNGLRETYTRIFKDIARGPLSLKTIALECFRWILYAKGPLRDEFLRVALALREPRPTTVHELKSKMLTTEYLSEACANLWTIEEQAIVQPIHFSVKEFLENLPLDILKGNDWNALADKSTSESILADNCIDLLLLDTDIRNDCVWMSQYAYWNFDAHALESLEHDGASSSLVAKINQLLSIDDEHLRFILRQRGIREDHFIGKISPSWLIWDTRLCRVPLLKDIWPNLERPKNVLILAVYHGTVSILESLISDGFDIYETDQRGWTPLCHACDGENEPAIQLLLEKGALADRSKFGNEVLHLAVDRDNVGLARQLLLAGADANEVASSDSKVPLMHIRSLAMGKVLCEEFKADCNIADVYGKTALFMVGASDDDLAFDMFEYLIEQGSDLATMTIAGMNILDHIAYKSWNMKVLRFLLQHHPQLASKGEHEWTALHRACAGDNFEKTKELLRGGLKASIITTTHPPGNWTPWDIAMHYSSPWKRRRREEPEESIIESLGGPTTDQTVALAEGDGPGVDPLVVDYTQSDYHARCALCEAYSMPFMFDCATCHQQLCLMCNHHKHSKNPDHEYRTIYHPRVLVGDIFLACKIQVPHIFDPERPDWKDWLEKVETRIWEEQSDRIAREQITELGHTDSGAASADI